MVTRNVLLALGLLALSAAACTSADSERDPAEGAAVASSGSEIEGVWERISLTDTAGTLTQPPAPVSYLMIWDGYFSQIGTPTGRPKVDSRVSEMTREELLARFTRVSARRGTYVIEGDTLVRTVLTNSNPNAEGQPPFRQEFYMAADTFVLLQLARGSTRSPSGTKAEARFLRAPGTAR